MTCPIVLSGYVAVAFVSDILLLNTGEIPLHSALFLDWFIDEDIVVLGIRGPGSDISGCLCFPFRIVMINLSKIDVLLSIMFLCTRVSKTISGK